VQLNNKYCRDPGPSLSIGTATSRPGLSPEKLINQADDAIYHDKAEYYKRRMADKK